MAYFPKVNIPNTFYVNEGAPSGGTKGSPSTPYESPWDLTSDLSNTREILRVSPGVFAYTGPYNANNSHVPNAENTTYFAYNSVISVDSVNTGTGALFSDRTGAGTDETRRLRLYGGQYYSYVDGATDCYALEFLNSNSEIHLQVEEINSDGASAYGIAIGGDLLGKVDKFVSNGGNAIKLLPGSNGSGPQLSTFGRRVHFEVNSLSSWHTDTSPLMGWENDGAEYAESSADINIRVNDIVTSSGSTGSKVFRGWIDGLTGSNIKVSIGSLDVSTSTEQNTVFELGSNWSSSLDITDSYILFELESAVDFSGRITEMSNMTLDNSTIHIKIGKVQSLSALTGFASFSFGGGTNLNNNSRLILEVDEFVDTGAVADTIIEVSRFFFTDATSKVIITGTFRTPNAAALLLPGESDLNIELKNVVFENDGTVAAIQRIGTETPTVDVAGVFDTNTIIAGAGVTINRYDEYV